jgi:hypothetical protein
MMTVGAGESSSDIEPESGIRGVRARGEDGDGGPDIEA